MDPLLSRLAGQVLMVGVSAEWSPDQPEALGVFAPGGVILLGRNAPDRDRLLVLTAALKDYREGDPPLIAIDHEGGRVDRLRAVEGVTHWRPAADLAAGSDAVATIAEQARTMARELLDLGIDLDLAPVVDVLTNPDSAAMVSRCYGDQPERVGELASAFIEAARQAGLLTCAKHFPGYGAVGVDPHHAWATAEVSLEVWRREHLPPFHAAVAAGVDSLMTAHVVMPALDDSGTPATLSKSILDRVRDELRFDGALLTDDLEMAGITQAYGVPEAAVRSLIAGADLILICHSAELQLAAHQAIVEAVREGRLAEDRLREAAGRVAAMQQQAARERV